MYKKYPSKQPEFRYFYLPFNGRLDPSNRWVRFAELIPWDDLEGQYCQLFSKDQGRPSIPVRVAFGSLVIQSYLNLTDRGTVDAIRENVYLQYFLGYREFIETTPFDPTMMVHFRKRIDLALITSIQDRLEKSNSFDDPDPDTFNKRKDREMDSEPERVENKGKLLIDATVAPADIRYPQDVDILNDAREKSEQIIDDLHEGLKGKERKVRTYRQIARTKYLALAKQKRASKTKIRMAVRSQLGYLNRNLKHISRLLDKVGFAPLSPQRHRQLLIISEVYRQQRKMWKCGEHRIDDRIVSCSQPHVRPIVRGKASASTEFGAKLSVSLVNGIGRVDHLSWDAFNESTDLVSQVEAYRNRHGFYPESVHADKIYRTRENRRFLKNLGIRLSGRPLGRPRVIVAPKERRLENRQYQQDERDRIPIEGKFGQGKRRFSLNRILAKLPSTSECRIAMIFFVMNLNKWLERIFWALFLASVTIPIKRVIYQLRQIKLLHDVNLAKSGTA